MNHDNLNIKFSKIVCCFCLILVIIIMIAASEIIGEREIIFPEVAALGIGCFLAPRLPWNTNSIRMFLCITICAIFGVMIVKYVSAPLPYQFILGYIIGQVIFYLSGTSLAPMISAICLPILISTTSVIYIIAAPSLTFLLILLRYLLMKVELREAITFKPVYENKSIGVRMILIRSIIIFFISSILILCDIRFAVAPPLLVAFTELTNPSCPASKHRIKVIFLVSLCGLAGSFFRQILVVMLGYPLTFAAFMTAVVLILLLSSFKLMFPPAGAIAVLALLIPENYIVFYPLHIILGISILVLTSIPISRYYQLKICHVEE